MSSAVPGSTIVVDSGAASRWSAEPLRPGSVLDVADEGRAEAHGGGPGPPGRPDSPPGYAGRGPAQTSRGRRVADEACRTLGGMHGAAAGWYPDPDRPGSGSLRWWDGTAWSSTTRAVRPPEPIVGRPSAPTVEATPDGAPDSGPAGAEAPSEPVAVAVRRGRRAAVAGVVAVVVAVAAAVVVAEQGSAAGPPTALTAGVLRAAGSAPGGVGSARLRAVLTVTVDGETRSVDQQGVENFTDRTSDVTLGSTEILSVGGVSYLRGPAGTLAAGKTWLSATPSDLGGAGSSAAALVGGSLAPGDPAAVLQYLGGVTGTPRLLGRDGEANRFAVVVDLKALLDRIGGPGAPIPPAFGAAWQAIEAGNDLSAVSGTVSVDARRRVVGFSLTLLLTVNGHHIREVEDLRLSEFGVDVSLRAPPARAVLPFSADPHYVQRTLGAATSTTVA